MGSMFDASEVYEKLDQLKIKAPQAMTALADVGAKKMEAYAKINARWTDRTGNARLRLRGSYEKIDNELHIVISHGVEYGIWLELAHEKRFAILLETLTNTSPEIIQGFQGLIEKIKV